MMKEFYKGWIILYVLLVVFLLSVSVVIISNRTEDMETRVDHVENKVNHLIE